MSSDIIKAGLLVIENEKILLCRKKHTTSKLILPGGKLEKGETFLECLQREVSEELGQKVSVVRPEIIGVFRDFAHSDNPEEKRTLEIHLFRGSLLGEIQPCAEIKEITWFGRESSRQELTPILQNKILPELFEQKILNWK